MAQGRHLKLEFTLLFDINPRAGLGPHARPLCPSPLPLTQARTAHLPTWLPFKKLTMKLTVTVQLSVGEAPPSPEELIGSLPLF